MTRKKINFKTKLCATLCQMRHEVDGKWELIIPHDDAVKMSEDQILSLAGLPLLIGSDGAPPSFAARASM